MQNLRTPVINYYQVLGISSDASPEDVKKAFRTLARRYHPDVNPGDQNSEEMFKQINEAYDILSDYTKRQQYDSQFLGGKRRFVGSQTKKRPSNGFPFPNANIGGFWQDNVRSSNGASSGNKNSTYRPNPPNIGDFRPGTTKTIKSSPSPRTQPKDIEAKLTLPLTKAYEGGRERIRLEDGRSLEVDMPPCMYHGQKIRLKGQGIRGGDLYLKILIEPHPFFTLQGSDISCEVPLTPSEAIVGGAIEVPTIDGLVKMNVPAGVKSGQRLKLANKGYPNIRGERGDQLVIINIVIPPEVSEEEKELYAKIREVEQFKPRQDFIDLYTQL
ncbi:J domain-containing protein [Cyanobacterium aponinum UTEX 3221]|uniref:J domain-containing protein n=1 Tax=Cyanobacterium aponinum TaxID=379064 RepID=UPI002B4C0B40|nr:J domain-containing protein [Cyanobacterium aponinum]WRL38632.1 J domain-containing protein [Cyanobacterium aponinum UTEX 3221]